jgi:DHA2 family multidrug resistance protein
MSYLAGGVAGGLEPWEQEYERGLTQALVELSLSRRRIVMHAVGLITAIEVSNRIAINVLLPDLQGNVAGNSDDVSWVLILYNLGFVCSIALSYWMTRVIGTRRHLLLSALLYSFGAIGCFCSAHSLRLLLISRVVMGFGGGAFLVRAVILAGLLLPGKGRAVALFWLFLEVNIFQAIYPVAMGWISDTLHWNYAFLLDFPFLAIGGFLVWKYLPRGLLFLRSERAYVDGWGAGLLIAALSCLQVALSRGERDEWFQSAFIDCFLIVALICFAGFLWWDWRPENPEPVLHLRLVWKQRPLRASLAIVMIVGAMLGAGLFVLPQYLRTVQDYSATQTGGFVSAYTLGLGVGAVVSLRYLVVRLGGTKLVTIGAVLMCVACVNFIYTWTPTTPTWVLAIAAYLQGMALGPLLVGASNVATGQAAIVDLNDVSTSFYFVRQLGNTLGITAATVILDHRQTLHSARLVDVANRLNPTLQATLAQYAGLIARSGGAGSNPSLGAVQLLQAAVIAQSKLLAYIDIYFGLAVLSVVILLLLGWARIRHAPVHVRAHFHWW